MKKATRLLSLLLAILMVMALAACGNSAPAASSSETSTANSETAADDSQPVEPVEATYPLTTENKKLTIYMRDNSAGVIGDYGRVAGIKAAAEKLGVELEFIHPTTGSEADQFNLMIGSGKYPDIIVWSSLPLPWVFPNWLTRAFLSIWIR